MRQIHAIDLATLTAVTIALAVTLVLQDIDSALIILTVASTLMIALMVLRTGSPKPATAPTKTRRKRRPTQPTGPQSALT